MGPGKADLLEAIVARGSISAAGRSLNMSYKRAWDLVNIMNISFKEPLITTVVGGNNGGGAIVTKFGLAVLGQFRSIESKANLVTMDEIKNLMNLLTKT